MQHLQKRIMACLLAAAATAMAADPVDVTVEVNRTKIYLGESVILSVKVQGTETPDTPDLSAIQNCRTRFLGSQSDSRYSVVVINGRIQKQGFTGRTFTFEVTPDRAGAATMGPVRVTHEGKAYTVTGPVVEVAGVEDQDYVQIDVIPSRTEVLVDEPFDITLRVRIQALRPPYGTTEPIHPQKPPRLDAAYLNGEAIDGLAMPDLNRVLNAMIIRDENQPGMRINDYTVRSDPFDFGSLFDPMGRRGQRQARFAIPRRSIVDNGRPYFEYSLALTYNPEREGSYTFGPVLFKGEVIVGVRANRQPVEETIFAVGSAATVRVVPPPEAGRPESYIGAIGSNLVVEATLDTQTCKVGDPLTLTLTVGGAVSLKNISAPVLALQPRLVRDFRVYDDTAQARTEEDRVLFTYMVRPLREGTLEVPPIEVAYYDVGTRTYRTAYTRPIPVRANAAGELDTDSILASLTNRTGRAAAGARPSIAPAPITVAEQGCVDTPLFMTPLAWLLLAAGPLFAALVLGGRALVQLLREHVAVLRRMANWSEGLRDLQRAAGEGAVEGRRDQLAAGAIRRLLGVRLDTDARSLMPADLRRRLEAQGTDPAVAERLAALLQSLFDASFAAEAPPDTAVRDTAAEALQLLHRLRRRRRSA